MSTNGKMDDLQLTIVSLFFSFQNKIYVIFLTSSNVKEIVVVAVIFLFPAQISPIESFIELHCPTDLY